MSPCGWLLVDGVDAQRRRAGSAARATAISRAIVAENSSVRRSAGAASRMNSRSSRKPRSSISSASSSTTARKLRRVEPAALEMVAQAARRADDHVAALGERARLAADVHAADAGDDAGAGRRIEPCELALHLQGELARRRDHQGQRRGRRAEALGLAQQRGDEWRARRRRSCPSRSGRRRAGRGPAPPGASTAA